MLKFESVFPLGDLSHKRKYVKDHLNALYAVFKKNAGQFYYLKCNGTTHDSLYFIDENLNHDIAATFHALPILENYISTRLNSLFISKDQEAPQQVQKHPLNWTDEKINLVELTYALYYSGCINDGKAQIRQIAGCFESAFSIKLNDISRSLQDLKSRQNQTKFLDRMKISLANQLELDFK